MLRAIVGIEILLTSLVGKWKVSQNRPPPIAKASPPACGERGDAALAREVRAPGTTGERAARLAAARRGTRSRCPRGCASLRRPRLTRRRAAPRRAVRGHDRAARARLHRLPRPRGPRRERRLLPAHRRQAGRLPVQPAAQLSRRPAPLRADGGPARAARRRLPARDRRPLRRLEIPYPPPHPPAEPARARARRSARAARRSRRAPAGVHAATAAR